MEMEIEDQGRKRRRSKGESKEKEGHNKLGTGDVQKDERDIEWWENPTMWRVSSQYDEHSEEMDGVTTIGTSCFARISRKEKSVCQMWCL